MFDSIFQPSSFFLLRSPIWPLDSVQKMIDFSHEGWEESVFQLYAESEFLREAIAIASPSLYKSISQSNINHLDRSKIAQSLLRYITRMTTRSTPFGLFSFVAHGKWQNQTNALLNQNDLYKKARPDMEWVYSCIQDFYTIDERLHSLSIYSNPLIESRGNRLHLNYIRNTTDKSKKTTSISATPLVRLILSEAERPITTFELIEKILSTNKNLIKEKIFKLIKNLISNQFIIPALLPSLLKFSTKEQRCCLETLELEHILKEIDKYNSLPIGKGEQQLVELQRQMEKIASAKTYIQLDTAHFGAPISISHTINEELAKTAELLWMISLHKTEFSDLFNYHNKFLERYGTHRTVPLLELLDDEKGLGSFINQTSPVNPMQDISKAQKWDRWLFDAWQTSLHQGKKEIFIDDKTIKFLTDEKLIDYSKIPFSFDFFFKIIANSIDEINKGNYLLYSFQNTWQGGSTHGRFVELLGPEIENDLNLFYRKEEDLDPGSCFVELSYFPFIPRSANVAIHPCLRRHRLDLGDNQNENGFSLKDIYVGATEDRFYLTCENGEFELHACISNMLNLTTAPLPIRFMKEVSLAKHKTVFPFSWGSLSEIATFLPRVSFGKTILSPATWHLKSENLEKSPIDKILAFFQNWAEKWSLPDKILLTDADQQLFLDRRQKPHIEEIGRRLKKGENLKFIEYLDRPWLKGDQGDYSPEIVTSYTKNSKFNTSDRDFVPIPYQKTAFENRWQLIGGEWLFAKIYLAENGKNRFLLQCLNPFTEKLFNDGFIKGWFFVRYADPKPHLRVRLKITSPEIISSVLSAINQASSIWLRESYINDMILSPYERELERYGGEDLIEDIESFFCADTLATMHLLDCWNKNLEDDVAIKALPVIHFLTDLGLSRDDIISFFGEQEDLSLLKGFREHKKRLKALIIELEREELFKTVSSFRKPAIQTISEKISNLPMQITRKIYASLLHMHCNRLGYKQTDEKRAILYSRHALKQIQQEEMIKI